MKPIIPFALLGAFFAVGAAKAVSTKPVGYTSATIYAAFAPGSPKTSVVSPDLQNSAVWSGTVDTVTGDILALENGSLPAVLTPGAYDNISAAFAPSVVYAYFIETADGYWAHIETNGASSVTVEAGAGAQFSPGEVVSIHRHVTISDYFGPANETGLLGDNTGAVAEADNVILIDEVNSSSVTIFPSNVLGGTWITDGFLEAGNFPIYPDQGMQVVRRGVTNLTVVHDGEVDTNGRQIPVTTGVQIRPYVLPVDTTLADLDLYTGLESTGLADDDGTAGIGNADTVQVLEDGATTTYFYSTLDLGAGAGWYTDGFLPAGILPAGAGLIINRNNPRDSAPFVWVVPAPTIAP